MEHQRKINKPNGGPTILFNCIFENRNEYYKIYKGILNTNNNNTSLLS